MTSEQTLGKEQYQASLLHRWKQLKTAETRPFGRLNGNEAIAEFAFSMPDLVRLIANGSGYAERKPWQTFPLSDRGLPWLERFLKRSRPPTAKYDSMFNPIWSEKEPATLHALERTYNVAIHAAALVFGQCLAQKHEMFWAEVPGSLPTPLGILKPSGNSSAHAAAVAPYWKVKKFVAFGDEDSLVGFSKVIGAQAKGMRKFEAWANQFYLTHPEYKKGDSDHRLVLWHGQDGMLIKLEVKARDVVIWTITDWSDGSAR